MKIAIPLVLVVLLASFAWIGAEYLQWDILFGVVFPYLAFALFVVGFSIRIIRWGRSAVPFGIPTTCGQQKSLPWIKQAKLDNPSSFPGVVGRMLLEIFLFRSLFRNQKAEKRDKRLAFGSAKWLWLGALVFHWSMLIIVLRHLRLFLDPVPAFIQGIEGADSFFQIGLPLLYMTDVLIVSALTFLFIRRVVIPRVRYVSLTADFFPLFLLLAIALSGIVMRYGFRIDLVDVKELTMGLVTFQPVVSAAWAPSSTCTCSWWPRCWRTSRGASSCTPGASCSARRATWRTTPGRSGMSTRGTTPSRCTPMPSTKRSSRTR